MGRMQREKGKRFERQVASMLRERWPDAVVRRASQAERADNPDVFVEGPPVLERLWLELQDAREPTPAAKLRQAEQDTALWHARRSTQSRRWPVVVWHKLGGRSSFATIKLSTLDEIRGVQSSDACSVTLELDAFLDMLALTQGDVS